MEDNKKVVMGGCLAVVFVVLMIFIWVFFIPPYNVPKFENIENNQTGFLVPMDGKTTDQAHFDSVDYLKERKVATKRVQVTRRWIQKWWLPANGEYIDEVRLIKVDRSPVIKEWTDELSTGSNQKDDSLRAQSKDGTGLKLNFTCTALIPEEHCADFLYWYKGDNLEHIMDHEVRARVQSVAAEFCAQYSLVDLRGHQHDLAVSARKDVTEFFAKRGIMITNLGLIGGFHYINPEIQKAIDQTIKDQQLQVSATAVQGQKLIEAKTRQEQQKLDNETMKLAAEGKSVAVQTEAEGRAAAEVKDKEGISKGIKLLADAEAYKIQQIGQNKDLYLSIQQMELERAWRTRWDGKWPQYMFGGGNMLPLMNIPEPAKK